MAQLVLAAAQEFAPGTEHRIHTYTDQGVPDADLWALAMAESRALITTDKGFTEYRLVPHHGILIVRLRQPNRQKIHHAVMHALERFPDSEWPNLLVVVRDTTLSTSKSGGDRG